MYSILIKVSLSQRAPNRGDQQSQRQSATPSRCYDIISNAPKYMTTTASPTVYGSKGKIMDAKCEFGNNKESDGFTPTVSHRCPLKNCAINRTASELM